MGVQWAEPREHVVGERSAMGDARSGQGIGYTEACMCAYIEAQLCDAFIRERYGPGYVEQATGPCTFAYDDAVLACGQTGSYGSVQSL